MPRGGVRLRRGPGNELYYWCNFHVNLKNHFKINNKKNGVGGEKCNGVEPWDNMVTPSPLPGPPPTLRCMLTAAPPFPADSPHPPPISPSRLLASLCFANSCPHSASVCLCSDCGTWQMPSSVPFLLAFGARTGAIFKPVTEGACPPCT